MFTYSLRLFLVAPLLLSRTLADFVLFPYIGSDVIDAQNGFDNVTAISTSCQDALNATIACEPRLQYMLGSFFPTGDNDFSAGLCASSCRTSLEEYATSVESACGSIDAFDGLPLSWRGDQLRDFLNIMCATDSQTGQYCVDVRIQQIGANPGVALIDLPSEILCSECQVAFFRLAQASPYNGYDDNAATLWTSVQQKCGTSYPVGVQTVNLTIPGADTGVTDSPCLSGRTYVVQSGDTCHSIALSNSVSEGSLWALNNILPDCSAMKVGQELCLPNSCTTLAMSSADSCMSVSVSQNLPYAAFLSWNPTINADCSNINPNGTVVCISSPFESWDGTLIPGATPTKTASYALSTSPAPAPTAFETTSDCGSWYVCLPGDDCGRITLQYSISLELLHGMNPSIDDQCANLVPGLAYCVLPTIDFVLASDQPPANFTVVSPPAPTPTGTTSECYIWHVAQSDETCALIAASFGISFDALRFWNPSLDEGCTNFLVGVAYCVGGAEQPPVTTTTTLTTASALSSTSTSSSNPTVTPSCSQTYTVISGDYCYKIYTDFSLTEQQFRALNPSLDANCDLDIGQVLCVASSGSASTSSAPATSTSSNSCSGQSYTVASGDYCYAIWTQFGLTEAEFRALNPSLDSDCTLSIGQVLCV